MSSDDPFWPSSVSRLWLGPIDENPRTVLFRRSLSATPGAHATLRLYAEGRFHLWCNGVYVTRGPLLHHPNCRSVLEYNLTPHVRAGRNTLAILAQSPGTHLHNLVWSAEPGPVGVLRITHSDGRTEEIVTDASWCCTDQSGWVHDVPRRGWALAWIEVLDARRTPFGWQQPGFDDSAWQAPTCLAPTAIANMRWQLVDFPPIVADTIALPSPTAVHTASSSAPPVHRKLGTGDFGTALLNEPWTPGELAAIRSSAPGQFAFAASPERATALVFDLKEETTGQILFDLEAESEGVVDIAWSETMHNDRPCMMLKGATYADRLLARAGAQHWEPVHYSAFRYVTLIFRGFSGKVTVRNAHIRATRLDINLSRATFHCSDDKLNAIWDMCVRTMKISPQEGVTDCPTREQAVYLADSPLVAGFLAMLTGDFRMWRHTLREVFLRPGANGLLKDAVYSPSLRSLADFNLVTVMCLADYLRRTGDRALAAALRPAAEGAVKWFLDRCDNRGLLAIDWDHQRKTTSPGSEPRYTGEPLPDLVPWLFLDHPGMGWHNHGDPGIDRRGISAAMHALLVLACDALADLAALLGDTSAAKASRARSDAFRKTLLDRFYEPAHHRFADSLIDGTRSPQSSQQTNSLALLAGCHERDEAAAQRLIDETLRVPEGSAWNGPYFWNYLLPVLARKNRTREAIEKIRTLWGHMLDHGATTLWETFAGDHLDSWCHPWSAAPLPFLAEHILGVQPPKSPGVPWRIVPQVELLDEATGSIPVNAAGALISVSWKRVASRTRIEITVPPDIEADFHHPARRTPTRITGTAAFDL